MAERRPVVLIGGVLQELPTGDTLPGGGTEFADDVFRVIDNLDGTKKIQFSLDTITSGATRAITVPDRSFILDTITSATVVSGLGSNGVLYNAGGVVNASTAFAYDGTNVLINKNLRIGTAANYVGFTVATPTSHTLTLPSTAPAANQVLMAGDPVATVLSWQDVPSGALTVGTTGITSGTTEYFLYNNGGVLANASELRRDATTGRIEVISNPTNDASLYIEAGANAFWAIDATSSGTNAQTVRFTATGTSGQAFTARTYGTTATAATFIIQRYGATGTTSVQRHGFFSQNFDGSTPGNGFGAYWTLAIKSSTTGDTEAGQIGWRWQVATHASRVGEVFISANNSTSAVEGLTITPSEVYSKLPLRIGTSANYVGLAVSSPTSHTLTLPGTSPSANRYLKSGSGTPTNLEWGSLSNSKTITIENPTNTDDITIFYTSEAATLLVARAVLRGSSTPSVTLSISSGTSRDTVTDNNVSAQTVTSTTTGTSMTIADSSIGAGCYVWIRVTAVSGTVAELHVTLEYS